MGDLISRQAVNGIIDALFQDSNSTIVASPNVLRAFRKIQNLPSSNTHNALEALEMRWIPCSERLPDDDGYYLVSTESGGVDIAYINEHGSWYVFSRDYIVAWQPLPEPYKEGEE